MRPLSSVIANVNMTVIGQVTMAVTMDAAMWARFTAQREMGWAWRCGYTRGPIIDTLPSGVHGANAPPVIIRGCGMGRNGGRRVDEAGSAVFGTAMFRSKSAPLPSLVLTERYACPMTRPEFCR